jgi:hypothetical protein
MIAGNIDPVEEWLNTDFMLENWPTDYFAPSEWLVSKYLEWAKQNSFSGCTTTKYFHRMMGELGDMGMVSKQVRKSFDGSTKYRGFIRLDPVSTGDVVSVTDALFILLYQKSGKILDFQKRIRTA